MRIERVDNNNIRIILSDMDFLDFDISKQELAMDQKVLHAFIMRLMDTISEETDFNPYCGNIMIKAHNRRDGMSITVSKLGGVRKYTKEELKKATNIKAKLKKEDKSRAKRTLTFFFEDFEALCEVIIRVSDDVHNKSALYNYNGAYCYITEFDAECEEEDSKMYGVISTMSEYSDNEGRGRVSSKHVEEHGTLIAGGEKLITMAEGLRKINIL